MSDDSFNDAYSAFCAEMGLCEKSPSGMIEFGVFIRIPINYPFWTEYERNNWDDTALQERLNLIAGPNGKTLLKAYKARCTFIRNITLLPRKFAYALILLAFFIFIKTIDFINQ